MKHRFCRPIFVMAISVHSVAGMALAQAPAELVPDEKGWLKWAIAAGILAVVCLPAFINFKRSHLS